MFAADGRTLIAANVTRIDDSGTFGLRGWNGGADWRRVRDEPGAQVPAGSIGPFAFDERLAAYSRDGRLELRELASGALVWTVPLVPPGLDAVVDDAPMRLELVAFARRGDLVLSYESPASGSAPGTLVFRRMSDGATIAMYDVAGVSALGRRTGRRELRLQHRGGADLHGDGARAALKTKRPGEPWQRSISKRI